MQYGEVAIDMVQIQGYSEGAEGQSYRNKGKDTSIQLCVNKVNLKEKWFTVVYQVWVLRFSLR